MQASTRAQVVPDSDCPALLSRLLCIALVVTPQYLKAINMY